MATLEDNLKVWTKRANMEMYSSSQVTTLDALNKELGWDSDHQQTTICIIAKDNLKKELGEKVNEDALQKAAIIVSFYVYRVCCGLFSLEVIKNQLPIMFPLDHPTWEGIDHDHLLGLITFLSSQRGDKS